MPATPGRTATICAYEARSTEAPATGERELQVLIAAWQETHAGFWKLMRPAVRPKIAPGKQRKKPSESASGSAKRKRFRERQSTIIMQWVRASQSYEQRQWLASSPSFSLLALTSQKTS
jgi:hypothetical protein